jgi:hypothetical protein
MLVDMTKNNQLDQWDFEELVLIDKRIDTSDAEGIRDRWEFGRRMLADRKGKKRLPNGYLAALVECTGKSRAELGFRIQFAEQNPTEAELSNALDSFSSWHDVVQNLSANPEADPTLAELIRIEKRIDEADARIAEITGMSIEMVRAEAQKFMAWCNENAQTINSGAKLDPKTGKWK